MFSKKMRLVLVSLFLTFTSLPQAHAGLVYVAITEGKEIFNDPLSLAMTPVVCGFLYSVLGPAGLALCVLDEKPQPMSAATSVEELQQNGFSHEQILCIQNESKRLMNATARTNHAVISSKGDTALSLQQDILRIMPDAQPCFLQYATEKMALTR